MAKAKAKINSQVLTMEQRKKLLLTPCKTKAELKNWIKYHTGFDMPDHTVSRYADTNPLDAIWQIYDICVNQNNPDHIEELLYVAGRGSGKCVVENTVIPTKDGPKYIQNIEENDLVWTGWNWQPVIETFNEGIKPGVTVTTRVGKKVGSTSLTGSLKHRVQAFNDETQKIDWVYMKDLVPGQIIYKTAEKVYDTVDVLSENYEKGWLIGVIVGDGCVSRHGNNITVCGADFKQLRHYSDLAYKYHGVKHTVRRNSKHSVNLKLSSPIYKQWFHQYVDGELSYDKVLKTLEHSPDFLAGFISGIMETDGSKDAITLANPKLIEQIGAIFTLFGVSSSINTKRRKPSTTKFKKDHIVNYSEIKFDTLPDSLLPIFSKRESFVQFRDNKNEQFRYPTVLIKSFGSYIKKKYEVNGGYWNLGTEKKTHSNIEYARELWGSDKDIHIYGHKIDSFIRLADQLEEKEWVNYLKFIRNGHYERVDTVTFDNHYFYDLEVAVDHAYTSNGFVSHNTLGVALAEFMVMLHDQRDVVHVGAIMSQAKRCYEYQVGFLLNDRIKSILETKDKDGMPILEKANMEKSTFNLVDRNTNISTKVTLEVLPCTLKAVNGPHVPLVSVDEIDTVSGEGLRAFKDIAGMVDSRNGRSALRVGISTRKSRYGLMNRQIEEAEQAGRTVRRWTALEFSDQCKDERSGTTPTVGYVMQDTMEVITEELWERKDKQKKTEYVRNLFPGEKCLTCPIAATCLGDAKNQQSKSKMLKPIGDTIKKAKAEGPDWVLSQLFNLKPSVEGIIYKEFDEKTHVKNWNQMWFILTGQEYPGLCDHDIFVKKCHQLKLTCYAGIDWGWSNPSTVVYFFVDSRENVYVVRCEGQTQLNNPTWAQIIKHKWHQMYRCQLYFPDLANPGDAVTMKTEGLPCPTEQVKDTDGGIQIVKKWLRSFSSPVPKMFFAKETCGPIIQEFQMFHFKTDASGEITDDAEKEFDHWLDALRYAMYGIFGKSQMIMGTYGMEDHTQQLVDRNGTFSRQPSAEEFAKARGIPFNPNSDVDKAKLGKIGRKSELEGDEADDGRSGGDGAFLWSF